MIVPYFAERILIDFTYAVPVQREDSENYDIAMYIHPRISLLFRDVWATASESVFDLKYSLECAEDLNCVEFDKRVGEFEPHRKARVQRRFDEKRESIFFDSDEIEFLSSIFDNTRLTSIIEIRIDDKVLPVDQVTDKLYKIVKPYLTAYDAVEMITPDEYRRFKSVKSVMIIGGRKMGKGEAILKTVGGALVAGIGITGVILGAQTIKEGILGIQGKIQDVEIIKK